MAFGFRRTTFSFKRLTQDEIAAIGPLKIRFETVLEGAVLKHWPGVCR